MMKFAHIVECKFIPPTNNCGERIKFKHIQSGKTKIYPRSEFEKTFLEEAQEKAETFFQEVTNLENYVLKYSSWDDSKYYFVFVRGDDNA